MKTFPPDEPLLPDNFETFDRDQLELLRDRLQLRKLNNIEAITSIKNQIEEYGDSGDDPTWLRRARMALRHRGRDDQTIAMHLTTIARRISEKKSAARKVTFQHAFIETARTKLSAEMFTQIAAIASRVADDAEEEG